MKSPSRVSSRHISSTHISQVVDEEMDRDEEEAERNSLISSTLRRNFTSTLNNDSSSDRDLGSSEDERSEGRIYHHHHYPTTRLSPKSGGRTAGNEKEDMFVEFQLSLKHVLDQIQALAPKRLRSIKMGEDLRDLLERMSIELSKKFDDHLPLDEDNHNSIEEASRESLSQLIQTLEWTKPVLKRIHQMNALQNVSQQRSIKRQVARLFQELNGHYTTLLIKLSMSEAKASSKLYVSQVSLELHQKLVLEAEQTSRYGSLSFEHDHQHDHQHAKMKEYHKASREQLCLQGDQFYFGHGLAKNLTKAFKHYHMAARMGHPRAMNCVARMYEQGLGVSSNAEEAKLWWIKSAQEQDPEGLCRLGELNLQLAETMDDDLQQQDLFAQAMSHFISAAKAGHAEGATYLALCYQRGLVGGFPDPHLALKWFQTAAQKGEAISQRNLGSVLYRGDSGLDKDVVKAVYWFHQAAKQGDAIALNNLGLCYETGQGVVRDLDQAKSYYQQSAAFGHASAKVNLGFILLYEVRSQGSLGSKNERVLATALALFLDATAANLALAYYGVASILHREDRKSSMALRYYVLGAERRHGRSARMAAEIYYHDHQYERAYQYYALASEICHEPEVLNALGIMREEGLGCDLSLKRAAEYYQDAAEAGYADGHYNLALMFCQGSGVRRDVEKAKRHLELAKALGHTQAFEKLTQLDVES